MKVLLMYHHGSYLVWEDATKEAGEYVVSGKVVPETNIISVIEEDNSLGFVRCSNCGEIILNTEQDIEKHRNKYLDVETCIGCRYMKRRDKTTVSSRAIKEKDGLYSLEETTLSTLYCNYHWTNDCIGSKAAQNHCRYRGCKDATFDNRELFFDKYPGAFDDIITVDTLVEKRCEFIDAEGYVKYRVKSRNNLQAYTVNGLVVFFYLTYRGREYNLYFSKRYNKLFCCSYDSTKFVPFSKENICNIPEETVEYIFNKIYKLYN